MPDCGTTYCVQSVGHLLVHVHQHRIMPVRVEAVRDGEDRAQLLAARVGVIDQPRAAPCVLRRLRVRVAHARRRNRQRRAGPEIGELVEPLLGEHEAAAVAPAPWHADGFVEQHRDARLRHRLSARRRAQRQFGEPARFRAVVDDRQQERRPLEHRPRGDERAVGLVRARPHDAKDALRRAARAAREVELRAAVGRRHPHVVAVVDQHGAVVRQPAAETVRRRRGGMIVVFDRRAHRARIGDPRFAPVRQAQRVPRAPQRIVAGGVTPARRERSAPRL